MKTPSGYGRTFSSNQLRLDPELCILEIDADILFLVLQIFFSCVNLIGVFNSCTKKARATSSTLQPDFDRPLALNNPEESLKSYEESP